MHYKYITFPADRAGKMLRIAGDFVIWKGLICCASPYKMLYYLLLEPYWEGSTPNSSLKYFRKYFGLLKPTS